MPRLAVAARLRESVAAAAAGADWRTPLLECLRAPGYRRADLTLRGQDQWFCGWSDTGDPALEAAIAGYASTTTTPGERFAAFADAAAADSHGGVVRDDLPAVMAFGSLLNFGVDPRGSRSSCGDPSRVGAAASRKGRRERLARGRVRAPSSICREGGRHARQCRRRGGHARRAGDRLQRRPQPRLLVDRGWTIGRDRRATAPRAHRPTCPFAASTGTRAPYLREWIEFHRLVGVERFFLYNNRSIDDHREVLAPYVEEGIVAVRDWPLRPGPASAYDDCLERAPARLALDRLHRRDEFLFSPIGRPVSEVLGDYEEWPGVGVNWATFGTSGTETKPEGLVIENYLMRSTKSFAIGP